MSIKNTIKTTWFTGELEASCNGPTKPAYVELVDELDGMYSLLIRAQESGLHMLNIKYGGTDVPGDHRR